MADLSLDILVIPTYNTKTLGIADNSTYPESPAVESPTIEITVPGFGLVSIPFVPEDFNVFNSTILEITSGTDELLPIPDGLYTLTYSVAPANENYVTKTIYRVEQLQERFDEAFMKLDLMECNMVVKKQAKMELMSIWFFIQAAMAAANNCNTELANNLYLQASRQLNSFIKNNCGCSGTNYL